jgi:hypothetical protein
VFQIADSMPFINQPPEHAYAYLDTIQYLGFVGHVLPDSYTIQLYNAVLAEL